MGEDRARLTGRWSMRTGLARVGALAVLQLQGLEGTLGIRIEAGGAHFYDFEGTLPGT